MVNSMKYSIERALSTTSSGGNADAQRHAAEARRRADFKCDRYAILRSPALARLRNKTQMIPLLSRDDVCTRYEHALEVAALAGSLARLLDLNPVLSEAIALGHDLGHPPFGHAGERALRRVLAASSPRGGGPQDTVLAARDHHRWSVWLLEQPENWANGDAGPRISPTALAGVEDPSIANRLPEAQVIGVVDSLAWINRDLADLDRCGFRLSPELSSAVKALGGTAEERIERAFADVSRNSRRGRVSVSRELARTLDRTRAAFSSYCRSEPRLKRADRAAEAITRHVFLFLLTAEPHRVRFLVEDIGRNEIDAIPMQGGRARARWALHQFLRLGDPTALVLYESTAPASPALRDAFSW